MVLIFLTGLLRRLNTAPRNDERGAVLMTRFSAPLLGDDKGGGKPVTSVRHLERSAAIQFNISIDSIDGESVYDMY